MLTLIFLFYQRLSFRTRLIAGISVLAIITIIFGSIIIYQEVLTGLHRYTNNQTVFYLELNLKKNDNLYGSIIINRLLADFELINLDRNLLTNNLALSCDSANRLFKCQLIFKTNSPSSVVEFLTEQEINFSKLSKNTFVIGRNLDNIKKNYNPLVYLNYKTWFNNPAILIITKQPTNLFSKPEKLLKQLDKNLKLTGVTSENNLKLKTIGLSNIFYRKNTQELENLNYYDFFFNSQNQKNWLPKILNSVTLKKTEEIKKLNQLNSDLTIILKQKVSSSKTIKDYDFFIKLETEISEDNQEALKELLLELAQLFNPLQEIKIFSNNDRLILLKKNNNLNVKSIEGLNFIELSNDQRLFIEITDRYLTLTNQFYFQVENEMPRDYIFINLKTLSDNNFFNHLLTDFQTLEVINNQLILK